RHACRGWCGRRDRREDRRHRDARVIRRRQAASARGAGARHGHASWARSRRRGESPWTMIPPRPTARRPARIWFKSRLSATVPKEAVPSSVTPAALRAVWPFPARLRNALSRATRVARERDELEAFAIAVTVVTLTWWLLLGWSWPHVVYGFDDL